jgi:ABC-type uncharacterized transport system ATPase subunit
MVEVRTEGITKVYGRKVALSDINIRVRHNTLAFFWDLVVQVKQLFLE